MSLIRVFFLIITLFAGQPCFAQSDTASTAGKQYLVELIAFQYQGPDSSAGEEFEQLVVENYLPRGPVNIDEHRRVREAVTYAELVHLSDALRRLRASPQYSILTSAAWVQPLLNRNRAVDVPLGSDDSRAAADSSPVSTRISGSVSVYGDYLLFVELDIRAALPRGAAGREESGGSSSSSIAGTSMFSRPASQVGFEVFRIAEKRRIKLEEIHYFDHPYIGVVLSVTRYE